MLRAAPFLLLLCALLGAASLPSLKGFSFTAASNRFITPNGDGKNDNWQIDGLEKYPNSKVKVFNRWGSSIYSDNNGYQVPWDGTHQGAQLASGTYYYVIELKGSPDNTDGELSGSLTIVK